MQAFLIRLLAFTALVLATTAMLRWHAPYHWANTGWNSKLEAMQQDEEPFNVYFIGSSRTYHGVDPILFDSLVEGARSFNLGYLGTYGIEALHLADEFLRALPQDSESTTVVWELQHIRYAQLDTLHGTRRTYMFNGETIRTVVGHFIEWGSPPQILLYLISGSDYLFGFGHCLDLMLAATGYPEGNPASLGAGGRGFVPLVDNGSVWRKRRLYLSNPSILEDRREQVLSAYLEPDWRYASETYLGALRDLERLARSKGVRLVFAAYPRDPAVPPIYAGLDARFQFDLNDPRVHPLLYDPVYTFDEGHLNAEGAAYFTKLLAAEFSRVSDLPASTKQTQ